MSKWLGENDNNFDYFHASVKSRGRRNATITLKVVEWWIEWVSEIMQEVVKHFIDIFKEYSFDRPRLNNVAFDLFENNNIILTSPPLVSRS